MECKTDCFLFSTERFELDRAIMFYQNQNPLSPVFPVLLLLDFSLSIIHIRNKRGRGVLGVAIYGFANIRIFRGFASAY